MLAMRFINPPRFVAVSPLAHFPALLVANGSFRQHTLLESALCEHHVWDAFEKPCNWFAEPPRASAKVTSPRTRSNETKPRTRQTLHACAIRFVKTGATLRR